MKLLNKIKHKCRNIFYVSDRLTLLLAVLVVAGTCSLMVVNAANGGNASSGDTANTSFLNLANLLSQAEETIEGRFQAHGADGNDTFLGNVKLGTVGNYLGPSDKEATSDKGSGGAVSSGQSADSYTKTIDTFLSYYAQNAEDGAQKYTDLSGASANKFIQYIMFGQMWADMGLDETLNAGDSNDIFRVFFGYTIYIAYVLAYTASGLVSTVIKAMGSLDIIGYLFNGSTSPGINGGDSTIISTIQSAPLMQDVKRIYTALGNFRFVILGLMIIIFVASITVFKTKAYNATQVAYQKAKTLFYRVVVMFIGVPLVMMIYHECISILGAYTDSTQYRVSSYIYEEFCDFGSATANPKYCFPVGKSLSIEYNVVTHDMVVLADGNAPEMAELIYNLNYNSGGSVAGLSATHNVANTSDRTIDYANLVARNAASGADTAELYDYCRSLVLRYAQGETIDPDTYTGAITPDINQISKAVKSLTGYSNGSDSDTLKQYQSIYNAILSALLSKDTATNGLWAFSMYDDGVDSDQNEIDINASDSNERIYLELLGTTGVGQSVVLHCGGGEYLFTHTLRAGDNYADGIRVNDASGSGEIIKATFDLSVHNSMSAMSMYNYMQSIFENGNVHVHARDLLSSSGVTVAHYSVTAAYVGLNEIIQLAYTLVMLTSFGMLGWVFGISMMMNIIVESIKMIPSIFKMMVGSIQGFVESLATVMAIITELAVTGLLYSLAVHIVDFIVRLMKVAIQFIMGILRGGGGSSILSGAGYDIPTAIGNAVAICGILWGTMQLIRWRKAIIITIKSFITTILNSMFGTKAQMPMGANGGTLGAVAAVGAGAMAAHALNTDGALGDVVRDMAGDAGESFSDAMDKIKDGDISGAVDSMAEGVDALKNGGSGSSGADGSAGVDGAAADPRGDMDDGSVDEAAAEGDISDWQASGVDNEEDDATRRALAGFGNYNDSGYTDEQQDAINEKLDSGDLKGAEELEGQYDQENFGDAERAEQFREQYSGEAKTAEARPNPNQTNSDQGWAKLANTYDVNGLTAVQGEEIDQMVADGATKQEIASRMDQMAQSNFGTADYRDSIDAINSHAGRSGMQASYGDVSRGSMMTIGSTSGGAGNVSQNGGAVAASYAMSVDGGDASFIDARIAGGGTTYSDQSMDVTLSAGSMEEKGLHDNVTTSGGQQINASAQMKLREAAATTYNALSSTAAKLGIGDGDQIDLYNNDTAQKVEGVYENGSIGQNSNS